MNFSERLQFAMNNKVIDGVKGVTAYRIGKDTSISKQSILGYLDKGVKPNQNVSIELASYLGVNVEWLITGNGQMYGNNNTYQEAEQISDINYMNVPLIHIPAHAGYKRGFGDEQYIENLPTIPVIVDRAYKGKYRVFEINGDSMDDGTVRSIAHGDKVLGREVKKEYWKTKLHYTKYHFVIVSISDGLLFKQIISHDVENLIITCHSLNPDKSSYPDFEMSLTDVAELYNIIKIVDRNIKL